jgi:peptide/nickel transport system substrate-binding protein
MTAATAALVVSPALADRGEDGQLNILYWQAPSIQNPYLSGGTKDIESSSLVLEPLAYYDENGNMVPNLAVEIPTVENGGVSADLTSITWKLQPGVLWSDGSALTAADVVFSGEYCMHPEGGCNASSNFTDVTKIEALDDLTVKITFGVAKPFPYGPFVGTTAPIIQKAQFENCMGAKAPECTQQNFYPVGTGPFKVKDFKANDVIQYEMNENYREDGKPRFSSILFKGGGDAASAARSVLETGEFDYAWNLQVEPEILSQMAAAGKGEIVSSFGTSVERLMVQFTNPDPALGDKRATVEGGPHPFLSDPAVRRALSLAIDRQILVDAGYGAGGQIGCNLLPAP